MYHGVCLRNDWFFFSPLTFIEYVRGDKAGLVVGTKLFLNIGERVRRRGGCVVETDDREVAGL